ncbi:piwi-like protein 1 [Gigantopelta aegis]|uniref:piwi-like protein 1 n=1 Tax=Gigantopelta aegis TaxID=1735272 RepID=UPI001B889C90|nr:piwi-like protein 1 [Gigantopelta aegis]
MASGGYGRGGRGAALLQALSQQARKPGSGQQDEKDKPKTAALSTTGPFTSVPTSTPSPVPTVSFGRGAYLSGLLKTVPTTPTAATVPATMTASVGPSQMPQQASVGVAQPMMSLGRGLAAMQALLESKHKGRGLPSMQSSPPAASVPVTIQATQVSHPSDPVKTSAGPPTRQFQSLALYERKPTISNSGKDGKPMSLTANYIRVICKNKGVYQYHVSYNPPVDSRRMKSAMLYDHKDIIGTAKAFDGSILYLPIQLPNEETVLTSERRTDGAQILITVKLVKSLPPQQCPHLYNILFRRIMGILDMCQVGRYYYNPHTPSSVPQHKLEVWPGYITSITEQEGGLMLLLDASHRVLRTETVLDVMHQVVERNIKGFQDEISKKVIGCIVLTRYNNKTYRVDDIKWDMNPTHKFSTGSSEEVSFIDYYKKSYNITVRDKDQPLLFHKPKRKGLPGDKESREAEYICLVPELCFMTGLSDDMRSDFRLMKDIATHTRVTPMQRKLAMQKFVNSVNSNEQAYQQLADWGLELDNNTIPIDGRLLPMEKIKVGGKEFMAGSEADYGREVTRSKVILPVALRNWIVFNTPRDKSKANDYIQMMLKTCPQMGIDCQSPQICELRDDRTETFIRALREKINPQVQIVVVICPTSRDDRYAAIKKLCCVECPVPSQVIIAKTISQSQKLRSVTQKIALQINCKLGGELWALDIPLNNLMVIGIDVYHDATKGKRSIAGFVASTNKACTRWYSKCCFQLPHQELVDGLKTCLISSLRKFHEVNHKLPDKIIVYRDGVGDGQLNTVSGYEVKQLESCFSHFGEYMPQLSVVVVQKRINTRLFSETGRDLLNPPPGTVVDHTVTRRDWYDFFLVSQHVRQGTVSPTHYVIVHDGVGLPPDKMQRLAYKMTHLYYNWPGTVRVPAPCQYAHKLAYLVGQNIHKEPSDCLSDRLFFL